MNPIFRNILAVIGGIIIGMIVNMGLIILSPYFIPPPEGVDPSNSESLKANMHLFEARHFIMPFLAHALGSFVGALAAGLIAASKKMVFALVIGLFFLMGGIASVFMLPSPTWFIFVDLGLAYIPTAIVAGRIASPKTK